MAEAALESSIFNQNSKRCSAAGRVISAGAVNVRIIPARSAAKYEQRQYEAD